MDERGGCLLNALARRRPIFSREPCNSAQFRTPRVRSRVGLEISASFALTISAYHLLALLHAAGQLWISSKTGWERAQQGARSIRKDLHSNTDQEKGGEPQDDA